MFKRGIYIFIWVCNFLSTFTQAQIIESNGTLEEQFVCIVSCMNDLSSFGQKYCQKHGEVLPIICNNCKRHTLSLGEFSGDLLGKTVKNAAEKKHFIKMKTILDNFIKLLISDAKEQEISHFVSEEAKNIEYHCPKCKAISWERINSEVRTINLCTTSLYCNDRVNLNDPQVIKQQTEDVMAFVAISGPWRNAIEKYVQKNNTELEIKCKHCRARVLNLGEFNGCLLAWITKAIAVGHDEFEKIKMLVERFVKLLSDDASSQELIAFMINVSNDMKEVCTHCHGVIWEKIA